MTLPHVMIHATKIDSHTTLSTTTAALGLLYNRSLPAGYGHHGPCGRDTAWRMAPVPEWSRRIATTVRLLVGRRTAAFEGSV